MKSWKIHQYLYSIIGKVHNATTSETQACLLDIGGVNISFVLDGPTYPLLPCLIKPFAACLAKRKIHLMRPQVTAECQWRLRQQMAPYEKVGYFSVLYDVCVNCQL